MGIGGERLGFCANDPMLINFFYGKIRQFGIVGGEGNFGNFLRRFEGKYIVGNGGSTIDIAP